MIKLRRFKCFKEVFDFSRPEKIRVVPKGRRLGFTLNAAITCIDYLNKGIYPILWGDTTYANIDRYFERYFEKILKKMGVQYHFDKSKKILKAFGGYIDFRSAEYPENWEGFGYKVIILNEAGIILKNDYLWNNAVVPMLLDYPDSIVIAGGTPKGKRTKKGKHKFYELAEKAKKDETGHYYFKQISTYENPKLKVSDIELMKENLPSTVVRQEVYGDFIDNEGNLMKEDFIKRTELPSDVKYFVGVDLAISLKTSADYTSIVVIAVDRNKFVYVVEVLRFKESVENIVNKIIEINEKYKPVRINIEQVQFQAAVIQEVVKRSFVPAFGVRPDKDKVTRFYSVLAKYEHGRVHHCSFPLLKEFENELLSFPEGEHDDMVDALVYACINVDNSILFL